MFDMISDLEKRGFIIKDIALELTKMMQHSKSYLRGDYKVIFQVPFKKSVKIYRLT